jgi:hypothetical protein
MDWGEEIRPGIIRCLNGALLWKTWSQLPLSATKGGASSEDIVQRTGAGVCTQGFTLARQVLYHLTHSTSPFPMVIFGMSNLCPGHPECQSS